MVQNILRVAGSTCPIFVSTLAKRISRHANTSLHLVARVASCARTVVSVAVAIIVNRNANLVSIEEPSVRTL